MKRLLHLLLQHQPPSLATYTEKETSGDPKKKVWPDMILYVSEIKKFSI